MRWSAPPASHHAAEQAADRQLLQHLPVAYLLSPDECGQDKTNYWIFSDAGLRRLIDRTGWEIENYLIVGQTENADPFTMANDARSFCLIKSRYFEN
jgi:hypothetical protein